jgi:hypothetical protein
LIRRSRWRRGLQRELRGKSRRSKQDFNLKSEKDSLESLTVV